MNYKNQTADKNDIICDLSQHMNKLTEYQCISDDLTDEQESKLIDYIRAASKMSFERISRRSTIGKMQIEHTMFGYQQIVQSSERKQL